MNPDTLHDDAILEDDTLADDTAAPLADDAQVIHATREEWLTAATDALRPMFAAHGAPLPQAIRVTCGFPSTAVRSGALGETWADTASRDKTIEVLISPVLDKPGEVLQVLISQLAHACPGAMNFGNAYRDICQKMQIEPLRKDWKATRAAAGFDDAYRDTLQSLGIYSHGALALNAGRQKQTTRMLKAHCGCGYIIRLTQKHADRGLPVCVCGNQFTLAQ